MRLYSTPASPFGARVLIQIAVKGLPVRVAPPPGGLGSEALRRLSPLGKVPLLEVDGRIIPESSVIQEYLEDRFAAPAMRGRSASERACVRLVTRLVDLQLLPALQLLRQRLAGAPSAAPEAVRQVLRAALDSLEGQLADDGRYAVGDELTLADCALVPMMFYVERFGAALPGGVALTGWRRLGRCLQAAAEHPEVAAVMANVRASARPVEARA